MANKESLPLTDPMSSQFFKRFLDSISVSTLQIIFFDIQMKNIWNAEKHEPTGNPPKKAEYS
ncbi:hypothetical protein BIY27_24835 [Gibbsiella quercinecans]|nr:hypothetical protein BIY27_24835 [Gibbsiella quercinecans]